MKARLILLISVAFTMLHGSVYSQQIKNSLIKINLDKEYSPKKIHLTDIANISYVRMDATNDDYLYNASPVAISKNSIIIHDFIKGDFLFFSKEGKAKSKFNHKGEGPGEYIYISGAIYDDEKDELFVATLDNKIEVYTSLGKHKRTLSLPTDMKLAEIVFVGSNSLLLFDNAKRSSSAHNALDNKETVNNTQNSSQSSFIRISRTNGKIEEYIKIPENFNFRLGASFESTGIKGFAVGRTFRIINYKDGLILQNQETDTAFYYSTSNSLNPIFTRIPAIKTMNPIVYINGFVETANYQFMETVKLKSESAPHFPSTFIMRDKKDGTIYKQHIILDDYIDKEIKLSPFTIFRTRNAKVGHLEFNLEELKEALTANKLKGKLKDLVASMDEDENNVIVLLHFK